MPTMKPWLFILMTLPAIGLGGCRKSPPPPAAGTTRPAQPTDPLLIAHPLAQTSPTQPAWSMRLAHRAGRFWRDLVPHIPTWDTASFKTLVAAAMGELHRDPQAHLAAGHRALRDGRPDDACECYARACELDGANPDAWRALASSLLAQGQYERAIPVLQMIEGLCPDDRLATFNLGAVYARLRRFEQAEACYRRLLQRPDAPLEARYNLASLYQAQGKLKDAIEQWQALLARQPDLTSARDALAQALMDRGDAPAAMDHYAQIAAQCPQEVSAWLNLATAARAAGSLGRSAAALRRATQLAPRDAHVWQRLGQALLDLHRVSREGRFLDDAAEAWQRSLQLDPNQPALRDWLRTYRPSPPAKSN